jgi:hypothetical protein
MSFKKSFNSLSALMKDKQSDILRVWGTDRYGTSVGLLAQRNTNQTISLTEDAPGTMLTVDPPDDTVRLVSVPKPDTFFPLPGETDENYQTTPVGAMLCERYGFRDGDLEPLTSYSSPHDVRDFTGNITGSHLELLYDDSQSNRLVTQWNLALPEYRDPMTPRIPPRTLLALFDYGKSAGEEEQFGHDPQGMLSNFSLAG